ncbi:MAG: hypothetical protein WDO74_31165 [Pseudomonadota bacterium]
MGQRSQALTPRAAHPDLEDAIRIATHGQQRDQHQTQGDTTEQSGAPRRLRFDRRQWGAIQLALKMQLRELERTDPRIARSLFGQRRSAQRAFADRPIDGHEHAPNRALHVAEVSPIARAPEEDCATARISKSAAALRVHAVPSRANRPAAISIETKSDRLSQRAGVRRRVWNATDRRSVESGTAAMARRA